MLKSRVLLFLVNDSVPRCDPVIIDLIVFLLLGFGLGRGFFVRRRIFRFALIRKLGNKRAPLGFLAFAGCGRIFIRPVESLIRSDIVVRFFIYL